MRIEVDVPDLSSEILLNRPKIRAIKRRRLERLSKERKARKKKWGQPLWYFSLSILVIICLTGQFTMGLIVAGRLAIRCSFVLLCLILSVCSSLLPLLISLLPVTIFVASTYRPRFACFLFASTWLLVGQILTIRIRQRYLLFFVAMPFLYICTIRWCGISLCFTVDAVVTYNNDPWNMYNNNTIDATVTVPWGMALFPGLGSEGEGQLSGLMRRCE